MVRKRFALAKWIQAIFSTTYMDVFLFVFHYLNEIYFCMNVCLVSVRQDFSVDLQCKKQTNISKIALNTFFKKLMNVV